MTRVLLILPAKDEERNLGPLIQRIDSVRSIHQLDLDVVVVDDGSSDGTAARACEIAALYPYVRLLRHEQNRGLGATLRTGMAFALANGYSLVACMDADLSQDPEDLPRLCRRLEEGADLVVGSRFVAFGAMEGVPAWRALISRAGNGVARRLLGIPIRDMTSGYRAFRAASLAHLDLHEPGYGIQLEAVVKAHVAGQVLAEEPIMLRLRQHGNSKLLYNAAFWRRYVELFLRAWGWTRRGR